METCLGAIVIIALLIYFWQYVLGFLIFVVVVTGLIYAITRILNRPDQEDSSAVKDPIGTVAFHMMDIGLGVFILSLIALGIYLVIRLIIWLASL